MPGDTPVLTDSSNNDGDNSASQTENVFFVGKYKDRDAAEEGLQEKDRYIQELREDRDQAQRKSSQLETEVLAELAKNSRSSDANPEQVAAQRESEVNNLVEELAAAFSDDDMKGSRKALQIMSSYAADVQDQAQSQINKAKSELTEQFGKELEGVKNVLAERDPDMVTHGDAAKKLAESAKLDFSNPDIRKTLINVVKVQQTTQHPERSDLPGGSPVTRVMNTSSDSVISDTERAIMASVGIVPTKEEELALSRMSKHQR